MTKQSTRHGPCGFDEIWLCQFQFCSPAGSTDRFDEAVDGKLFRKTGEHYDYESSICAPIACVEHNQRT